MKVWNAALRDENGGVRAEFAVRGETYEQALARVAEHGGVSGATIASLELTAVSEVEKDDRDLAQALVDGVVRLHEHDDEYPMIEAEGAIIERLGISPNETEQGLTDGAVQRIEAFVSENVGWKWTYESAGLLGATR
jgi:hypothetical protein